MRKNEKVRAKLHICLHNNFTIYSITNTASVHVCEIIKYRSWTKSSEIMPIQTHSSPQKLHISSRGIQKSHCTTRAPNILQLKSSHSLHQDLPHWAPRKPNWEGYVTHPQAAPTSLWFSELDFSNHFWGWWNLNKVWTCVLEFVSCELRVESATQLGKRVSTAYQRHSVVMLLSLFLQKAAVQAASHHGGLNRGRRVDGWMTWNDIGLGWSWACKGYQDMLVPCQTWWSSC